MTPDTLGAALVRIAELERELADLEALARRHAEIYQHKLAELLTEMAVQKELSL